MEETLTSIGSAAVILSGANTQKLSQSSNLDDTTLSSLAKYSLPLNKDIAVMLDSLPYPSPSWNIDGPGLFSMVPDVRISQSICLTFHSSVPGTPVVSKYNCLGIRFLSITDIPSGVLICSK